MKRYVGMVTMVGAKVRVPVVHYLALWIALDQAIYLIYLRELSIIQAIHILDRC